MAKYRKKSIVIEAEQWFPGKEVEGVIVPDTDDGKPYVETHLGPVRVRTGDWITTDVKGERYPCAPDIFEAMYERVTE